MTDKEQYSEEQKRDSTIWLKWFSSQIPPFVKERQDATPFEEMMKKASQYIKDGYSHQVDDDWHYDDFCREEGIDPSDFWRHYYIVTGEKLPRDREEWDHGWFNCHC